MCIKKKIGLISWAHGMGLISRAHGHGMVDMAADNLRLSIVDVARIIFHQKTGNMRLEMRNVCRLELVGMGRRKFEAFYRRRHV